MVVKKLINDWNKMVSWKPESALHAKLKKWILVFLLNILDIVNVSELAPVPNAVEAPTNAAVSFVESVS